MEIGIGSRSRAVGKQITLPWSKAVEISVESLRVRLSRSIITSSSIILATAFLAYTLGNHNFLLRLLELNDPTIEFLLQKRGIDIETGKVGIGARELWVIITSMLVCLVGVSNALLMSVTERIKEIGTMKCLGALDSFVVKLFLIEALFMGAASSVVGAILGVTVSIAINWLGFGFIAIANAPWLAVLTSGIATIFLGTFLSIFAAIYPSVIAARMQPVEAMRKEV